MITVGVIWVGSRLGSGMGAGQMPSMVIIPGGGRIRIPRVANVHVTDFRQLPAHNTRTLGPDPLLTVLHVLGRLAGVAFVSQ